LWSAGVHAGALQSIKYLRAAPGDRTSRLAHNAPYWKLTIQRLSVNRVQVPNTPYRIM